jgi:hypothetical protein
VGWTRRDSSGGDSSGVYSFESSGSGGDSSGNSRGSDMGQLSVADWSDLATEAAPPGSPHQPNSSGCSQERCQDLRIDLEVRRCLSDLCCGLLELRVAELEAAAQ